VDGLVGGGHLIAETVVDERPQEDGGAVVRQLRGCGRSAGEDAGMPIEQLDLMA